MSTEATRHLREDRRAFTCVHNVALSDKCSQCVNGKHLIIRRITASIVEHQRQQRETVAPSKQQAAEALYLLRAHYGAYYATNKTLAHFETLRAFIEAQS